MKATRSKKNSQGNRSAKQAFRHGRRKTTGVVLPALVVLGGAGIGDAHALELGNIHVQSRLGQPLRASIAYALNPGEQIAEHCIFLRQGSTPGDLPAIRNTRVRVEDGLIRVTGSSVIREPLMSFRMTVDCPRTAQLTREYAVFVDPGSRPEAEAAPTSVTESRIRSRETASRQTASRESAARLPLPQPAPAPVTHRAATQAPPTVIAGGTTYRVQPGDTLSGIASRLPNREAGLWATVDLLFAANPEAFIGDDPNLLKAGALLVVPEQVVPAAANPGSTRPAAAGSPATPVAYAPPAPVSEAAEDVAADPVASATDDAARVAPPVEPPAAADAANPFVEDYVEADEIHAEAEVFAEPQVTIPDTVVFEAPPAQPAASAALTAGVEDESSLLAWLGAAGVALLLGLLLFGRRLRERFGGLPSDAVADDEAAQSMIRDLEAVMPASMRDTVADGVDADLGTGAGFRDTGRIEVREDLGFEAASRSTTSLDLELSADSATDESAVPTDVIPEPDYPALQEAPSVETGQYELDDAANTDATTRDQLALNPEDAGDEDLLKILEQDYELSATQAFQTEALEKAAKELAQDLEGSAETAVDEAALSDDDATREMETESPDTVVAETADTEMHDADLTEVLDWPTAETVDRSTEMTVLMPDSADDSGANEQLTTDVSDAQNDATLDLDLELEQTSTTEQKKIRAS